MRTITADGSSYRDAPERVTIDTSDSSTKWKYGCPRGHTAIDPTDGGIWCKSCANAADVEDPHYVEILNKRTGELVPWSVVDWK